MKIIDELVRLFDNGDGTVSVPEMMSAGTALISSSFFIVPKHERERMMQSFTMNLNMQTAELGPSLRLYTEADIKAMKDTIDSLQMALRKMEN